ncbi:MAG: ABC transporter permease [Enterococcus sp.]
MIAYFFNNWSEILTLTVEHLELVLASFLVTNLIALPLGLILSQFSKIRAIVLLLLSGIYTIPSLAFFVILLPFLGLGFQTAVVVLSAYSLCLITRNILTGIAEVDSSIIEAAKGCGFTDFQVLLKYQFVYALPSIIAGERIAVIAMIGIATIASWINAGGLGTMLFEGLNQNNYPEVLVGSLIVSLMAFGANHGLAYLQKVALAFTKGKLA